MKDFSGLRVGVLTWFCDCSGSAHRQDLAQFGEHVAVLRRRVAEWQRCADEAQAEQYVALTAAQVRRVTGPRNPYCVFPNVGCAVTPPGWDLTKCATWLRCCCRTRT